MAILKVTASILENCSNKHLYSSCEVCVDVTMKSLSSVITLSETITSCCWYAAPDSSISSSRSPGCDCYLASICCSGPQNTHCQHPLPWRARTELKAPCSCTRLGRQRAGDTLLSQFSPSERYDGSLGQPRMVWYAKCMLTAIWPLQGLGLVECAHDDESGIREVGRCWCKFE